MSPSPALGPRRPPPRRRRRRRRRPGRLPETARGDPQNPRLPAAAGRLAVARNRDYLVLAEQQRYPAIADLAEPMLRLAGLRINPKTNGPHRPPRVTALTLHADRRRQADVAARAAREGADPALPVWSPDGKRFAVTNTTADGHRAVGRRRRDGRGCSSVEGVPLNAAFGDAVQWMPDGKTLLVPAVPAGRGKPPDAAGASRRARPIQEAQRQGRPGAHLPGPARRTRTTRRCSTTTPRRSSPLVDADDGEGRRRSASRRVFAGAEPVAGRQVPARRRGSSGRTRTCCPCSAFPHDGRGLGPRAARSCTRVAELPLQDQVPIEGVPTGPRGVQLACRPSRRRSSGSRRSTAATRRRRCRTATELLTLAAPFAGQAGASWPRPSTASPGLTWGEKAAGAARATTTATAAGRRRSCSTADEPDAEADGWSGTARSRTATATPARR